MDEIASLQIKTEVTGAVASVRDLDALEKKSIQTEKATEGLAVSFKNLKAPLNAAGSGALTASGDLEKISIASKMSAKEVDNLARESKNMEKATDSLAGSVKDLSKPIQESISINGKLATEVKAADKATDGLTESTKDLKQPLQEVIKINEKLAAETKDTDKATDGLTESVKDLKQPLDRLAKGSKKASGELTTVAKKSKESTKDLDRLEKQTKENSKASDGFTGSLRRYVGVAALAATATATLGKVASVSREFDKLNAQLETATGSSENAATAFSAIQDFATETPFDLQQVTTAFVKLTNLGLSPSERAITSYGDTASAMGKSLDQFIEAVADAATAEFERLKEFGIRAKNQGDTIAFTFKGVTTTVANNAAAIEEHLVSLGENNFAGAMARRMETLDGAIANLGDEWNKLFLNISQAGIGSAMEDTVRLGIDALAELNAQVASGQIEASLDAVLGKFDLFGEDVEATIGFIGSLFEGGSEGWAAAGSASVDFIIDAFKNMPENIRTAIQLVTVEIASLVDQGVAIGGALVDVFVANFIALAEKAKVYGKAVGQALNPFSDGSFDVASEIATINQAVQESTNMAALAAQERVRLARESRTASIISITDERDAALASFDAQIAGTDELRKKFDEAQVARRGSGEDRLEQFGTPKEPDAAQAVSTAEQARRAKDFEKLVSSLQSEEESIQASYERRLEIVNQNTEVSSEARAKLTMRLEEELERENSILERKRQDNLDSLDVGFKSEEEKLLEWFERKRELILENEEVTEGQRLDLMTELEGRYTQRQQDLELQRQSMVLSTSAGMFGDMSSIAKTFAGEQSGVFQALFAASKAFAVADSVVKIQQGIAAAATLPWPANLAAMASTVAATASIVGTISGTNLNLAGAYDLGGMVPAGKTGLVGEFGPELIQGPAVVTSRRETASILRDREARNNLDIETRTPVSMSVNMNVNTKDARSFKESKGKIEADMASMVFRASKRSFG